MKSYVKSKVIILLTLGIIFVLPPIITNNLRVVSGNNKNSLDSSEICNLDRKNLQISAVSGKIHIDNNWTAVKLAGICTGSGTNSEPYVIKDLMIDGGGSGSCILIENSNVYFRIENCKLYNSGAQPYEDAGIKLKNTCNGTLIYNNCSNNQKYGILLINNCDNNNISGNTVNYNMNGIRVSGSNYNNISGNIVNYNNFSGIYIDTGNYTTISGNIISDNDELGIIATSGKYITISGNMMNNCGLITGGSLEELSSHDIDTKNLVNGKPLYYYTNEVNLGATDFTNAGQVILVNCNDSVISNLDVSHGSCGISLIFCYNNIIRKNNANYNNWGIWLDKSDHNDITQNIANHNEGGIGFSESDHNRISGNTANYNELGMYLTISNDNFISGNIFNNNEGDGIKFFFSNTNIISGNTVRYSRFGIRLTFESGNNSISGNIFDNNNNTGIYIDRSDDNKVSGNTVNYNNDGMRLYFSNNNNISGNRVLSNSNLGLYLNYHSHDNTITLNCFINNNINADCDGSNNHWDNGIKGNYWGNYNGSDTDEDGIGDVPYNITGIAGSQDNFPLMKCPISTQGGGIPGYNPFFVLSILSVVAILISRKFKKSQI